MSVLAQRRRKKPDYTMMDGAVYKITAQPVIVERLLVAPKIDHDNVVTSQNGENNAQQSDTSSRQIQSFGAKRMSSSAEVNMLNVA